MNKKISLIALLLVILSFTFSARAQSSVGRIIIKSITADSDGFPDVVVKGVVLDSDEAPVSGVTKEMLSVTENGIPVDFEISEVASGTRTVMVLDMGKWINNQAIQGRGTVKDKMQNLALRYIDVMKDEDLLEIVVVYGYEASVAQTFTNDKTQLREVVKKLKWNNEDESYGLEALIRAIPDIADAPNDLFKKILFISPGIMTRDIFGKDEIAITQELNSYEVPVYSVNIPWSKGSNYFSNYKYISENTKGRYFNYLIEDDLTSFFLALENKSNIYQIVYRSASGEGTSRSVSVSYQGASGVSDSMEYSIDSSLIAPGGVEILVNNGEMVSLLSENPLTSIPVHINITGLGKREIKNIVFQANGQSLGDLIETSDGAYSTTWSFPTENFPLGNSEMFLEVIAEDELGVVHQGSSAITISLSAPTDPFCRGLSSLPGIGTGLGSACISSGFTLAGFINIILFITVLALGAVLWLKRDKVVEYGKEIGVRVTNVVDRLTNRLRKLEPKARLIVVQGISDGNRKEFDLFGETPIGRSNENAELIFDNDNISRLHCIIHEGHTGNWTIEDQESANGTFINGQKLTPFVEKEIESGMLIELGPVEYGGIKFRFELVDVFSVNDDDYQKIYEESDTVGDQKVGTRLTKNVSHRSSSSENTKKIKPEGEIDPSDPANQKW